MKSDVYSWRLSHGLKSALEHEAQALGISVAALLDRISAEWLANRRAEATDEEHLARIRASAACAIGSIEGQASNRSERARELVRERLRARAAK
ncbi:MAG: hypothetical protein HY791_35225 [Deltaproteobacteria bacterium]|nr:hypothetical protein [Deltaproteobacteria bacterium]